MMSADNIGDEVAEYLWILRRGPARLIRPPRRNVARVPRRGYEPCACLEHIWEDFLLLSSMAGKVLSTLDQLGLLKSFEEASAKLGATLSPKHMSNFSPHMR
jgi:hypothetical protein